MHEWYRYGINRWRDNTKNKAQATAKKEKKSVHNNNNNNNIQGSEQD